MFYFSPNFICLYNQDRLRFSWLKGVVKRTAALFYAISDILWGYFLFDSFANADRTESVGIMLTAEQWVAPDSTPLGARRGLGVTGTNVPLSLEQGHRLKQGHRFANCFLPFHPAAGWRGLRKHWSWAWY